MQVNVPLVVVVKQNPNQIQMHHAQSAGAWLDCSMLVPLC